MELLKNVLLIVTSVLLTSCADKVFYQVYEMNSSNSSEEDSALVFENEDCRVAYDLWADSGDASFYIYNKTMKNLYLVMPQSFFILNGVANDYYSGSSVTQSFGNHASSASESGSSVAGLLLGTNANWYPVSLSREVNLSIGLSNTMSIEKKEMALICVPPESARFIKGFNISNYVYKDCDNYDMNYPKKNSTIIRYDESNTPLKIKNRLAYTFDPNVSDVQYMEHLFWLATLQNYSRKDALIKVEIKECESSYTYINRVLKMKAPNKYYNRYEKTDPM